MVRPSFLDKFAAPGQRQGEQDEMELVRQNIEAVLNTKEGYGYFVEGYGLGRYTEKLGTQALLKTLESEMLHAISVHEPRLEEAELELVGRDSGLWLHFALTCVLQGTPRKLRILFHTVSAQVRVSEDEGA